MVITPVLFGLPAFQVLVNKLWRMRLKKNFIREVAEHSFSMAIMSATA